MFNNNIGFKKRLGIVLLCIYIVIAGLGVIWLSWQEGVAGLSEIMYQAWFNPQSAVLSYHSELKQKVDIDKVVSVVHKLESSGGVNDGCKRKGGVNGYGYRQNSNSFKCYDNATEVRAIVTHWFTQKIVNEHLSLAQALCLYNQGLKVNDCPYFQNYKKLSNS